MMKCLLKEELGISKGCPTNLYTLKKKERIKKKSQGLPRVV